MSLIAEAPNFLQVFSNGTIKRFTPEIASPVSETTNPYKSKDVTIDSIKPITARIFIPNVPTKTTSTTFNKLPILVYFHGGGFCIGSTTWLNYDIFLGNLASQANLIVLSIDYRLAPENRLPIAYLDAYTSLKWLINEHKLDSWLNQGDLSRVFLSGDSAGGNIVHNVAIMSRKGGLQGIEIKGLLLIHPFFGSEKRTSYEMVHDESETEVKYNDMFWKLSIPQGLNRDYFGCNFAIDEDGENENVWDQFPTVVVYVAELDFLKERGVMYGEYLREKGVKNVKIVEAKNEGHVFHVYYPHSQATSLLMSQMSEFINSF